MYKLIASLRKNHSRQNSNAIIVVLFIHFLLSIFLFVDFLSLGFLFFIFFFSFSSVIALNGMLFALLYWFGIQYNHIPFRSYIYFISFFGRITYKCVMQYSKWFCVAAECIFASNKNDNATHTNNENECSTWFCYRNERRTNTHSYTSLSLIVAGRHSSDNRVMPKLGEYDLFVCLCSNVQVVANSNAVYCGNIIFYRKPNA